MTRNESNLDRLIRLVIAAVAVAAAAALGFGSVAGMILLAVAGIMALTATVGFCPLYAVFGLSTCPAPSVKH